MRTTWRQARYILPTRNSSRYTNLDRSCHSESDERNTSKRLKASSIVGRSSGTLRVIFSTRGFRKSRLRLFCMSRSGQRQRRSQNLATWTHVNKPFSDHVSEAIYVDCEWVGHRARGVPVLRNGLVASVRYGGNQILPGRERARETKVDDIISGRALGTCVLGKLGWGISESSDTGSINTFTDCMSLITLYQRDRNDT